MTITLQASYVGGAEMAAPVLSLQVGSDAGVSETDLITNNANLRFLLVLTEGMMGDTIEYYKDGDLVFDFVSSEFTQTDAYTWPDGAYEITAKYRRGAAASAASNSLSIVMRTVAPVLTDVIGTETGALTANIGVTTDVVEGLYWYVVDENLTTPTAAQIMTGLNAAGTPARLSGTGDVVGVDIALPVTGMLYDTDYRVYWTVRDDAGNIATPVASATFTTDAVAKVEVWESSTFVNGNMSNPYRDITVTAPGRCWLVVSAMASSPVITGITYDGDAPDDIALAVGAGYNTTVGKELIGPVTVRVQINTSGPAYTTMPFVVLLACGGKHTTSTASFGGSSGTQTFVNAAVSTAGIGLAFCCTFAGSGVSVPASWANATRLADTEYAYIGIIASGAAYVQPTWSGVTCQTTSGGNFLSSSTWIFEP